MRTLKLKKSISADKNLGNGVFSFILAGNALKEAIGNLNNLYQRQNLCLKVFKDPVIPLDKFTWGYKTEDHRLKQGKKGSNHLLIDCTKIQNIFAMEGIAPRVYDIVFLKGQKRNYWAQLTNYLQGEETKENPRKISEIRGKYNIYRFTDPNKHNCINGKIVDFQGFNFKDKEFYKKYLIESANTKTDWGSKSGISYEDVFELGIEGQRNTKDRAKVLNMYNYDFRNKTVLDIGCSTGSFCRLAARKGASRVVGIDFPKVTRTAWEISNYLGNWNIDYYGYKFSRNDPKDFDAIKKMTRLPNFDIVLFLSVNAQIGYPTNYIGKLCKEAIFVEGHSAEHEHTYRPLMEKDFKTVKYMGQMKNNARPALVGIK